jgi:hypothetical protein
MIPPHQKSVKDKANNYTQKSTGRVNQVGTKSALGKIKDECNGKNKKKWMDETDKEIGQYQAFCQRVKDIEPFALAAN